MVQENSLTVEIECEQIELETWGGDHTEPSVHFRKANTEPSMHFRKANTEPSMHFTRDHMEFLFYKMLGKNLHFPVSLLRHLKSISGKNFCHDVFS